MAKSTEHTFFTVTEVDQDEFLRQREQEIIEEQERLTEEQLREEILRNPDGSLNRTAIYRKFNRRRKNK